MVGWRISHVYNTFIVEFGSKLMIPRRNLVPLHYQMTLKIYLQSNEVLITQKVLNPQFIIVRVGIEIHFILIGIQLVLSSH